jgi:hypothetical protein
MKQKLASEPFSRLINIGQIGVLRTGYIRLSRIFIELGGASHARQPKKTLR